MENQIAPPMESRAAEALPRFPPPKSSSFSYQTTDGDPKHPWARNYSFSSSDRRLAFSRQPSFRQSDPHTPNSLQRSDSLRPYLSRSDSSISILPSESDGVGFGFGKVSIEEDGNGGKKLGLLGLMLGVVRAVRSGNRPMKRLALLISLNVAYSTTELMIGLLTGRVGLVSDAFHLTFGCGLLTFSLFAMVAARKKPDGIYTYGYKRLEVLAAFTNAIFLLFMSFSLAVEALHAFIQDESEHKHYLIVSAVTNLLVNLIGVWFFRSYARVNLVYRNAEDMNNHSICLHVLADSIRSAGLVLASWFLTLGVENAEVLCLGLVSVAVFMVVLPLFRATGSILLQMAPGNVHPSAFSKCLRQITALEDVAEVSQVRFWELVPGHAIGSLSIQIKPEADDHRILQYVHGLYHDLGIQNLTVQTDYLGSLVPRALGVKEKRCSLSNQTRVMVNWNSSANDLQGSDMSGVKIRKPYTMTKQREKWTEEEHDKFLEALKLYGRAWRRIEEHIGTKTAVQIRSHAQKFFTKMGRESAGNKGATGIGIEIPPPRPKRKPIHPYPRKSVNPSRRGIQVATLVDWCLSSAPSVSVSEQTNQSPTSVLSITYQLDATGSSGSDSPHGCTSQHSPVSGTNPSDEPLNEEENECQYSKDGSPSKVSDFTKLNTEVTSAMELDSGLEDTYPSKESTSEQIQGTSLKLFGQKVFVAEMQKPTSSSAVTGNAIKCNNSTVLTDDNESHQSSTCQILENPEQPTLQTAWNNHPWHVGMPPMFFLSPLPVNPAANRPPESSTLPWPIWWPLYGGAPLPFVHHAEACTESDSSSASEVVDSQLTRPTETPESIPSQRLNLSLNSSPTISPKPSNGQTGGGFVPYKRCKAEKALHQPEIIEDKDGQSLQLCL
ncbi:hypothetical protein J5N97_028984 [Dioscorea zingiberensis]|uniref:Uncharacterized protein n=1 Tax=Dioscorea zingiberensis TaxID=325984 RepID=A0A9D5BZG5_9LILI|nr:hypothetical protein J5N97_028984 [Dioscorea zingiberensis]